MTNSKWESPFYNELGVCPAPLGQNTSSAEHGGDEGRREMAEEPAAGLGALSAPGRGGHPFPVKDSTALHTSVLFCTTHLVPSPLY